MPISNPDTGILIVNTFPAELGGYLSNAEKALIEKLGGEFHVRAMSALSPQIHAPVPEQGVILYGSPYSILDPYPWLEEYKIFIREMIKRRKQILGICFGQQILADFHGATIKKLDTPQHSQQEVKLTEEGMQHPLFQGLPKVMKLPGFHFNHVSNMDGIKHKVLASTTDSPNYAVDIDAKGKGTVWGVQFHPEMDGQGLAAAIEMKKDKIPDWKIKKAEAKKLYFGKAGSKIIENYGREVLKAKQR